jgi:hypothetical protein
MQINIFTNTSIFPIIKEYKISRNKLVYYKFVISIIQTLLFSHYVHID